mgnify:CR=1 FL=1
MSTRISNTHKKHQAVYDYFLDLFDNKRLRIDDSYQKTAEKFFYSVRTVEDIVRKQAIEAEQKKPH